MNPDSSAHLHNNSRDQSSHPRDHSSHGHEHEHGHALEQQLNEMVQQGRVLEAYLNDIMSKQAAVGKLLEDARLASVTIQGLSADLESETLMPIGIGVYIKTNVPPIKKVLVNLGSGVTVEKNRDDALNYIEARIKEYEIGMRQLDVQRQQIAMQMEQIQQQVNHMIQSAQAPQS